MLRDSIHNDSMACGIARGFLFHNNDYLIDGIR